MTKEIYLKICEYTYKDELIALEGLFECDNFEDLGICIFEIIKSECLNDITDDNTLKNILLHPRKMQDFSSDNFYEVLSKEVCEFEILPLNNLNIGSEIVNKIITEINIIHQQYNQKNNCISSTIDKLKNDIDEIKNKISSDRDILKPLKQLEDQKANLLNEKRLLELEFQQRQHIFDIFQDSFCDILDHEIQKRELYRNSVQVSRKNRISDFDDLYDNYRMQIDIFKRLFSEYDNVFFKSKLYYFYDMIQKKYYYELDGEQEDQTSILERYEGEINSFPKIQELRNLRLNDLGNYKRILKELVEQYEIINFIERGIETNYCLIERTSFLHMCIEFYKEQDYVLFNNIIASQIEGMFNDFMKDTTTYLRLEDFRALDTPILREVLKFLNDVGKGVHLEIYLYFFYYFVDQVRNPIAHGDYHKCINAIDDETLSIELIMDMASIIYLIQDFSESSRIRNFFKNFFKIFFYKGNPSDREFYGIITNELLGERMHLKYQKFEFMNGIELLYWVFNPYYHDRIEFYQIIDEVERFKRILCSEEFWSYINENLDKVLADEFCQYKFSSGFKFVVCRMFPIARMQNQSIIPLLVEAKKKIDEIL